MKARGLTWLLLCILVAAACGSDPKPVKRAVGTPAVSGIVDTSAVPGDGGEPVASAGASSGTTKKSTAKVTTKKSTAVAVPTGVPGVPPITGTEIKVGIQYISDAGSTNQAAGFGAIGQIKQKRGWDAMVAEINKSPVNGRKVVPVYKSVTESELTSKGGPTVEQEACELWTKQNLVFSTFDSGAYTLNDCLTAAKIGVTTGGAGLSYAETFRKYPYLIEHNAPAVDRMVVAEIDRFVEKGFFSTFKENALPYLPAKPVDGKPKIGLFRYDHPAIKASAVKLKERLAAHGLALCDGCEIEIAYSADNAGAQLDDATEMKQAVNTCKSKGCTHILFGGTSAGGRIPLFGIQEMESQQYRPRIGFNSNDLPQLVANTLGAPSYPQMRMSLVFSWGPGDFKTETHAPHGRCIKLFQDAGETFGGSDDATRNKDAQADLYCDTAWYFQALLRAAGRDLTIGAFLTGVANQQTVESASTFTMKTTAQRHDGAGGIKMGAWDDGCTCFMASTGVTPF